MKFKMDAKTLIKALETVSRGIENKTTEDSLASVLIQAADSKVKFTTNSRDTGVETLVDAVVEEEGVSCVKFNIFASLAKTNSNDVCIFTKGNDTILQSKDSVITLPTFSDGKATKELPKDHYQVLFRFKSEEFKRAISQVAFAALTKGLPNTSKFLTGINLKLQDDHLVVTALDNCKIARTTCSFLEYKNYMGANTGYEVTIPKSKISYLLHILDTEEVLLYGNRNRVLFLFGNSKFMTSVIADKFMDISPIFAMKYPNHVTISKKVLGPSVERSKLLMEANSGKKLFITIEKDKVHTEIKSGKGFMEDSMDAITTGEPIKIALNPQFLLEIINAFEEDAIHLHYISPKKPCIFKDRNANYLLTPINF